MPRRNENSWLTRRRLQFAERLHVSEQLLSCELISDGSSPHSHERARSISAQSKNTLTFTLTLLDYLGHVFHWDPPVRIMDDTGPRLFRQRLPVPGMWSVALANPACVPSGYTYARSNDRCLKDRRVRSSHIEHELPNYSQRYQRRDHLPPTLTGCLSGRGIENIKVRRRVRASAL